MKRAFDIAISLLVLLICLPVLALVALLVAVSSPGPVLYRASRAGQGGRVFTMYKFRTMHHNGGDGALITAPGDARIFPLGRFLRRVKLDEMPQVFNVLRGDMSIVGPRPEDPGIVSRHYTCWMHETLDVRPGLTSPGAIWTYAEGDSFLDPTDPDGSYVRRQLPVKLAIEHAYFPQQSLFGDVQIMFRTIWVILGLLLGQSMKMGLRGLGLPQSAAEAHARVSATPAAAVKTR